MHRGLSLRTLRTRVFCSQRSIAFLAVAVTVFWIFHATLKISRTRYKSPPPPPATEANRTSTNSFRTKTIDVASSTTLPSNTWHNSTILSTLLSVSGGFLSQAAPFPGTGQGNLMFMYASLLGIAYTNQMTPVYPELGHLRNIFNISAISLSPLNSQSVSETKACAYDAKLSSLPKRPAGNNVTAIGYLQSWKYFGAISDRVRREFTFVERLRSDAEEFLRNISESIEATANRTVVYIGVHVRRRDMLVSYNVVRGYTVATKEYLASAVQYFRSQFPSQPLVFVVCTDEVDWTKQNFRPSSSSNASGAAVVYSENRDAAQDMALLSACNHSIITVGTYGWWSAYLAGGRTVYYKNFPAPGTHIANVFDKNDYYPPEWIGMG